MRKAGLAHLTQALDDLVHRGGGVVGGALERLAQQVADALVVPAREDGLADGGAVGRQRLTNLGREADALRRVHARHVQDAAEVEHAELTGLAAGGHDLLHGVLDQRDAHAVAVEGLAQQVGLDADVVTGVVLVVHDVVGVGHGVQDGEQAALGGVELAADVGHGEAAFVVGERLENREDPQGCAVPLGVYLL